MSNDACGTCSDHSGVVARLGFCEDQIKLGEEKFRKMDNDIDNVDRKFTQIMTTLVVVLIGVVANFGYMLVK